MDDSLVGRVAIVTGASRGIGRAIAGVFAREGAQVIICGRKQESLDRVASEIGGRVLPMACHVGRADEIRRLTGTVLQEFGRVDILVNNAGTNIAQEPVLQTDEVKFDKMIEINLKSAFRLIQAVAPGMCERNHGSIINIASIAGLRPQYHGMLYSMTKAALIMMPIQHLGQPDEIAELALLLASDRGSYITGQTMVVDGGRLLT
jgi:NAD(P)-dependent dehydrogenase (short-subunit alcohol dehydrogenase family)